MDPNRWELILFEWCSLRYSELSHDSKFMYVCGLNTFGFCSSIFSDWKRSSFYREHEGLVVDDVWSAIKHETINIWGLIKEDNYAQGQLGSGIRSNLWGLLRLRPRLEIQWCHASTVRVQPRWSWDDRMTKCLSQITPHSIQLGGGWPGREGVKRGIILLHAMLGLHFSEWVCRNNRNCV